MDISAPGSPLIVLATRHQALKADQCSYSVEADAWSREHSKIQEIAHSLAAKDLDSWPAFLHEDKPIIGFCAALDVLARHPTKSACDAFRYTATAPVVAVHA